VAHPDANIIFGTSIDDDLEDEMRVTVIAAGFDRVEHVPVRRGDGRSETRGEQRPSRLKELFGGPDDLGDDDLDVPSFLK